MNPRSETPHLDAVLSTTDGVWVRLALVDISGDLLAGVLLSQIAYWTPRATVEKNGRTWIVKAYADWWAEVRLSDKQARRGLGVLVGAGLVETHVWKWNGTPKLHLRIVPEAMETALARLALEGKSTCPQGPNVLAGRADGPGPEGESFPHLPETTTETTTEARRLCELLADLMEERGAKRPTITKTWEVEADRLLRLDGRDPAKAERLLRWSQADPFWAGNVHSMPTFRRQYDRLRDHANRALKKPGSVAQIKGAAQEYLDRRTG